MARKYARDNRGRFASKGTGATARGGRLKTAGGGKRATQTERLAVGSPKGTIGKQRSAKPGASPAASRSVLARSGQRVGIPILRTNLERGRKGVVSMSKGAKQARSANVAERKAEKLARIKERQSGILARRQINRLSTYSSNGQFNQSAATLNQKRERKSRQLQSWLTTRDPSAKPAKARSSRR